MHIPVLQKEVIEFLNPQPNENFIDATIGGGGHAFEILKQTAPDGKLLGIDINKSAIDELSSKIKNTEIKNRLILVYDNFSNLQNIIREYNFNPVQGVLADLGFSSIELERSKRGFSFLKDEPLDMRYSEGHLTAQQIVNEWSEKQLAEIFCKYGEERFSRQVARQIVKERESRPIKTTFQLVDIIKKATPSFYRHKKIHPATKIFQALRIEVNDELNNLTKFLPQALGSLQSGGRLVIISFHSLEDRIVKNFFKQLSQQNLIKILTKKPVNPSYQEQGKNPRSRSAKLRAVTKL